MLNRTAPKITIRMSESEADMAISACLPSKHSREVSSFLVT